MARDAENVYGSGFFKFFSQDLRDEIPDAKGFSPQNLYYMKKMYLLYSEVFTNCPQLVGNSKNVNFPQLVGKSSYTVDDLILVIPWGHHRVIIDKFSDNPANALFYVHKVVEEGWSRNVLKSFIDTNLHLRQGKALTSFSRLLPPPDSGLAQ